MSKDRTEMRLNHKFSEAKRTRRTLVLAFGLAMLVALLMFGLQAAKPAHAATTFTVNSTEDRGDNDLSDGSCWTGVIIPVAPSEFAQECTLRAAIQQANATPGADTIAFDIPGTGTHTISPGPGGSPR